MTEPQVAGHATAPSVSRSTPAIEAAASSKTGLFVGLGLGALIAVGGGVYVLGSHGATASAPVVASASAAPLASQAPSASAMNVVMTCPEGMIPIPGGSFFMGTDEGLPFEKPAHQVTLQPYCIDKFEVAVDRYRACSDGGRCKRAGITNEWADITDKERKAFDPLCNSRDPVGHAKHPINCGDWEMSEQICREQGGRLPTEAEWEFAARGPDGRKYPWGDDDPAAGHLNACGKECVAWGQKNGVEEKAMYTADDGFPNTAPVGSVPKGASRYGVEDVVGNVWEWVADWYGEYGKDEQAAPKGPVSGDERVIRGGSWNGSYVDVGAARTFRKGRTRSSRSVKLWDRLPLREVRAFQVQSRLLRPFVMESFSTCSSEAVALAGCGLGLVACGGSARHAAADSRSERLQSRRTRCGVER